MTGRRLHVTHVTTYQYSRPMSDGYTVAVVVPRATPWQTVEFAEVTVEPEPDERVEGDDLFGNRVIQLGIHHQHDRLTVRATSDVTVRPTHVDGSGPPWEEVASLVERASWARSARRAAVRRRRPAAVRFQRARRPGQGRRPGLHTIATDRRGGS